MMDGALYDPNQEDVGIPMPGPTRVVPTPVNPQPQPQGWFQGLQQQVGNNSDLLMAAAAGIGKGTAMGNMASSIQDHFKLQEELKAKKDSQAAMLQMKKMQLQETQRLNNGKIDAYTAKALKDGTAKVTNIGNGVVAVVAPGAAAPTTMTIADYQTFANQAIDRKGEWNVLAAGAKADSAPPSAAMEQQMAEARAAYDQSLNQIDKYQGVREMLQKHGAPEFQGLPIVSSFAEMLGTDAAGVKQVLGELKIDQAFASAANKQGAITDFERRILMAPLPADYANTDLWQKFIDRKLAILEKVEAFRKGEVERISNRPKTGVATAEAVIEKQRGTQQQPERPQASLQQYPKGFNPPSSGKANPQDQLAILQQELKDESAKPDSPAKQQNIAGLNREIQRVSGTSQAAAKPAAGAAKTRPPLSSFNR